MNDAQKMFGKRDVKLSVHLEDWRLKHTVSLLQGCRGSDKTSCVSLTVTPGTSMVTLVKLINDEFGTASCIRSRVGRLSVLSALTSVLQRLKLYHQVPLNGLAIFCGTVINEIGKEKRLCLDFEPHKPVRSTAYTCDNKFHVQGIEGIVETDPTYGIIILNPTNTIFAKVGGMERKIIKSIPYHLPGKAANRRGGSSAMRFFRLHVERRLNIVRHIAEEAHKEFILEGDQLLLWMQKLLEYVPGMPVDICRLILEYEHVVVANVDKIILSGIGKLKRDLCKTDMFGSGWLKSITNSDCILNTTSTVGKQNGFYETLHLLCEQTMQHTRFARETTILKEFMQNLEQDTRACCFGVEETTSLLYELKLSTIILSEGLMNECFVWPDDQKDPLLEDSDLQVKAERGGFFWFLFNNHSSYDCQLEVVSDASHQGYMFKRGFGGVGAIMKP